MSVGGTTNAVQLPQAAVPSGAASAQPGSPAAAWSDAWMDKFIAAGADSATLQQLFATGGDGMDEQGLAQALATVQQQANQLLTQFDAKYPGALARMRSADATPTQITDFAVQALDGMSKREVLAKVDEMYGASGPGQFRTNFGEMIPYSVVPGWGALSTATGIGIGLLNGNVEESRNPISQRQFFGAPMDLALTPIMAGFGAATLYNLAKEQSHLRAGHAAALVPGSAEAQIAKHAGVDLAAKPINPFTRANRVLAALGKYQDTKRGVEHLEAVRDAKLAAGFTREAIGDQAERARAFLTSWERGARPVLSDPVMQFTKMGIFPQTRGMILQRNKAPFAVKNVAGLQSVVIDTRASGSMLAAHGAGVQTQFASRSELNAALRSRGLSTTDLTKSLAVLREHTLATSTQDLLTSTRESAALVQQPTGLRAAYGKFKPNALEDGLKAITRMETGKLGTPTGLAALSKGQKWGLGLGVVAAAVGGVTLLMKSLGGGAAPEQAAGGAPAAAPAAG